MELPLRNKDGIVVAHTIIDEDDYEKVSQYTIWGVKVKGQYKYVHCKKKDEDTISLHHLIYGKPSENMVIDHINGNGLDNRKCNLREVTKTQNGQNRNSKKKYIGISQRGNKYMAIYCNKSLGTYDTEEEAAKHYDIYVYLTYGKDSKTNNMITYEESLKYNAKDMLFKKKSQLPKYIHYDKINNRYQACVIYKKIRYRSKLCKTIEDAQTELEIILDTIEKLKEKELEQHNNMPIERDENNNAIITISNNIKFIVDDDIWHELKKYTWCSNTYGYLQSKENGKTILIHQKVFELKHGYIPKLIDHINKDKLDNKIDNLRETNHSFNNHNKLKKKNTSSKYLGVSFNKSANIWQSSVKKDGKCYYNGYYPTEIEAAEAYNKLAIELYGEFANLNIIS